MHVSYERCIGCGACEFVCNKIVFGTPAMLTTSQGRAVPTTLPEPKKKAWIDVPAEDGAFTFQARNLGNDAVEAIHTFKFKKPPLEIQGRLES